MRRVVAAVLIAVAGFLAKPLAQEPREDWQALLRGNEQFGRKLLKQVHAGVPHRNAVVTPLPLSMLMAAIQTSSVDQAMGEEIRAAFGWGFRQLKVPSRMLLAAFENPNDRQGLPQRYNDEAWITSRLMYRSEGFPIVPGRSPLSDFFIRDARKYFGIEFEATGPLRSQVSTTHSPGQPLRLSEPRDVLVSSSVHLATSWAGNTFALSQPFKGGFTTSTGAEREVDMLKSELSTYRHARTSTFEAVDLACLSGHILIVLPTPGRPVTEVEELLVRSPDEVNRALISELESVTLPPFHTRVEWDLKPHVNQMGIRRPFGDLGALFTIPYSHFVEARQSVDISVDKDGIRAGATNIMGGIYGGMLVAQPKFSMELNRPLPI
jgi:serine protease inhibitor